MQELTHVVTGTRIRARRTDAGLSQQRLATKAGIGLKTLVRVEQGEDVRLGTLTAIAGALGISVSEMLAEDEVQA